MNEMNRCPHCRTEMHPVPTPVESTWGGEIHTVCFNDDCSYFRKSWSCLSGQGISGTGYRCSRDSRGGFRPMAVWSEDALKDRIGRPSNEPPGTLDHFPASDFQRESETPDTEFYAIPRLVEHLDSVALATVEALFARLIPKGSRVLDLMAGHDSHLPAGVAPQAVTGLGMNEQELQANPALDRWVIHDLNTEQVLPFGDDEFDAAVNTVSVDYLVRPVEVFREVGRVVKRDGLFIVVFSNRMFPPKAVDVWKRATDRQRVELVRRFFTLTECFQIEGYLESKGKPRPVDDKYYSLGIPSDPVYAVWGKVVK